MGIRLANNYFCIFSIFNPPYCRTRLHLDFFCPSAVVALMSLLIKAGEGGPGRKGSSFLLASFKLHLLNCIFLILHLSNFIF